MLNNPLSYTDPTGFSWWTKFRDNILRPALSIVAGIYLPGSSFLFAANSLGSVAMAGFVAGGIATGSLKGAVIGAFSGMAFYGVGTAFPGGSGHVLGTNLSAAEFASKTVLHGLVGGVMSVLQGGKFGNGFLSAGVTQTFAGRIGKLSTGTERVFAAAILGGTVSEISGGKFANGAVTGAFSRAFNEELHTKLQPNDKTLAMKLGEALRGGNVEKLLDSLNANIEATARSLGVDPDLIRAIIYEEQTHLLPFEGTAEPFGIGNTVGLGQVTVGLNGFTREQLLDPTTNIRAIGTQLSKLSLLPLINPNFPTASLATSYNCGSCTSITSYGRRVDSYYQGGK